VAVATPKKLPVKVANGLFVVPKSARSSTVRTSQETTCPFCMFATAEFVITKNGAPSIYCPRCRTRVFCQSLNSEIVVRAVCRAMREVEGLADQLTALYAQFIAEIPED
jgi:NAD-dependent DNA ligase